MALNDEDVGTLTIYLSPERLAALTELTGSAREAIDLHQETLRVGALLMNVLASIEIALRNSVCANLSQHFGQPNWFLHPPPPFQWRKSEKDKIEKALDSARRAEY